MAEELDGYGPDVEELARLMGEQHCGIKYGCNSSWEAITPRAQWGYRHLARWLIEKVIPAREGPLREALQERLDAETAYWEHHNNCPNCILGKGPTDDCDAANERVEKSILSAQDALAVPVSRTALRLQALERMWSAHEALALYRERPEEEYSEHEDVALDLEYTEAIDALRAQGGAKQEDS